jgi:mono/diheme cytochrome c family protein
MTLFRLGFLITALAIVTTACSTPAPTNTGTPTATQSPAAAASTPDEFATVRGTYAKECQTCHGESGQGGTAKVEGKTIKVPSLRSGHSLQHSDKDFTAQISQGGDGMPAFEKKLTPAEIATMIHFIRKEFQGK